MPDPAAANQQTAEPVILLCPCCASAIDAHAQLGAQNLKCLSCGQMWTMIVDADRQASHSLT